MNVLRLMGFHLHFAGFRLEPYWNMKTVSAVVSKLIEDDNKDWSVLVR